MYAFAMVFTAYISFSASKFVSNPFITITCSSAGGRPPRGSMMNVP
jgi:hypothetical protein